MKMKYQGPKDWKQVHLNKVATVQTGLAKGGKKVTHPIIRPYLRVANVQEGYCDLQEIKTIEVEADKVERYQLRTGDVLLTEGGDFDKLGRGTVWRGEISNCLHQNHIFAVRPNTSKLLPEFLAALTASNYGKNYFIRCSKQSTNLASINSTQLKEFPVLLPVLAEQKAITEILSTWDEAIEKADQLYKQHQAKYDSQVQIFISKKVETWKHVKVGDIFETISDKDETSEELLSVTQDQSVIPRRMLKGRVMSPAGSTSSYKLIKIGDFAVSLRSFHGGLEFSEYQGLISPAYTVLRPTIEINLDYFRHFFKTYIFVEKYLNIAVIGIRDGKQVSIPDLMTVKIPVPELHEQKQIGKVLSLLKEEIAILGKQAKLLKSQKRGLMQKLLTGQWRVKLDEGA